jgi:trk system potassium uptake protein TrkA
MSKKQYVVIGMGRFGTGVASTLINASLEVLVVDSNEEKIQRVSEFATHAVLGKMKSFRRSLWVN